MKIFIFTLVIQFLGLFGFSQKNYGDEYPVDTITFEDTCFYLRIDTSSANIWQIGEPQKTFFNTSFSLPNAIVTDTLNSYPENNYSYFDLIFDKSIFYSWFYDQMFFEIKYKIDTDTLKDGGYITISYDKGETWYNIINDTSYNFDEFPGNYTWNGLPTFLYTENDTLYNGEFGFSGKSDWITTRFSWYTHPCKNKQIRDVSDTISIRFNFISDNINNGKEGWMIDDIYLYNVDLGGNIEKIKESYHSVLQTNPVKERTFIEFDRTYQKINIQVFDIQGKKLRDNDVFGKNGYIFYRNDLPGGIYFIKLNFNNTFSEAHKVILAE